MLGYDEGVILGSTVGEWIGSTLGIDEQLPSSFWEQPLANPAQHPDT